MLLHLVPYIQTALLISQAEQNQHISCLVGLTCQETEASAVFGLSRESHLTLEGFILRIIQGLV